ncbi:MAG: acetyl-CoA carboxylase carboxyltransferase subunit alpha [Holosporales bacterium]|jgi:acetyl-CoA carboxylase carboxyl transferase subunit alpha|nr:acetyl-CoA carboxylase carboxyltransferase subunit alpha [Holosporales bacterium]
MITLKFEEPIFEVEAKINKLRPRVAAEPSIAEEVSRLEQKLEKLLSKTYDNLSPWERVQVARHSERPKTPDYIEVLISDFTPLAGDRYFGEDPAMMGGIGRLDGTSVVVIGQNKGHDTNERIKCNFGMPNPEGYRKARRLMQMADRFNMPLITFIDTAGAFPGIEAEERGQAEAIAKCLETGFNLSVPIVSTVIGEGGSGGAIAIGVANHIAMLENSVYSVISPEGCASILWKSRENAVEAANALRLTAYDLLKLEVIDEIIKEPVGGAHRHRKKTIQIVGDTIKRSLSNLLNGNVSDFSEHRNKKFLAMGRANAL